MNNLTKLNEDYNKTVDQLDQKYKDYTYLQNKIRKKILTPFDEEIKKLKKELSKLLDKRKEITKRAYNRNRKLQLLKQEYKLLEKKIEGLSNKIWKIERGKNK